MMDKNGIIDKDLVNLAESATKMFEQKMNIANKAINDLPESEDKKKVQLKNLLKSAKNKNANHSDLLTKLNTIINGG